MVLAKLKDQFLSPYAGCCIMLTTKHQKSIALAPPFEKILGAGMIEYIADTDQLGTFSGEIERKGTALEAVRKKCEWSIQQTKAEYALASEGSFGPDPLVPFISCNREILYFIDNKRKYHLYISDIYNETNYQMAEITSLDELKKFAEQAHFPSHALIIRSFPRDVKGCLYKGIETYSDLEAAYYEARKGSSYDNVWVETDMRAHFNPTRMRMIGTLGEKLAHRLTCLCPKCHTPGWGIVDVEKGLPCEWCGEETEQIKADILSCAKCSYKESHIPSHGKVKAEPGQCLYCNP